MVKLIRVLASVRPSARCQNMLPTNLLVPWAVQCRPGREGVSHNELQPCRTAGAGQFLSARCVGEPLLHSGSGPSPHGAVSIRSRGAGDIFRVALIDE
jgi:hypothetical protein